MNELTFCSSGLVVIWLIVILAVAIVIISIQKYFQLRSYQIDTQEFIRGLMNQLRHHNIKEAFASCDSPSTPVGLIARTAIEYWARGENAIRNATEESASIIIPQIERNMRLLNFLGNSAPVLGLIGTLLSMLSIFDKMAKNSGQFIETLTLAGDIRNSLICATMGLVVAIIAHFFYFIIAERIDHNIQEMHKTAAELTFFLSDNPVPKELLNLENQPSEADEKNTATSAETSSHQA